MSFTTLPKVKGRGKEWVRQYERKYGYTYSGQTRTAERDEGLHFILQSAQQQMVYVLQSFDGPEQVKGTETFLRILRLVITNSGYSVKFDKLEGFFNRNDETLLYDVSVNPGALFLLITDFISTNCDGFDFSATDPRPYRRLEALSDEIVSGQRAAMMRLYQQSKAQSLDTEAFLPTLLEVDGDPEGEVFPSMLTNPVIPIKNSGPNICTTEEIKQVIPNSVRTYFSNDLYARSLGKSYSENIVPSIQLAVNSLVNQENATPVVTVGNLMDTRQYIEPNVPNITYVRIVNNHIVFMNSEDSRVRRCRTYVEYTDGYAVRFQEHDPGIQEVIQFSYSGGAFSKLSQVVDYGIYSQVRVNCIVSLFVGLPVDSLGTLDDGLYCFFQKPCNHNSVLRTLSDFWQGCGQSYENFCQSVCKDCTSIFSPFKHLGAQACSHLAMHKFLSDKSYSKYKSDTIYITPINLRGKDKSLFDSGQHIDIPYASGRFTRLSRLCHCDGVHKIDILWWENSWCSMTCLVKSDYDNPIDLENFDIRVV